MLLGTWLLGSVDAFAAPVGTSPDEPDHWRYAYAVQTEQDTSDGWLEVPVSLTGFPSNCIAHHPEINAACVPRVTEDRELVSVGTPLVGAPILYYRLVGWPLTQWPDERGILISRVLAALVCATLWTIAILPWTGGRQWLVRLAVILTAAPAALYFSGTIQPSGAEIAAFAALWSLEYLRVQSAADELVSLPPDMDPGHVAGTHDPLDLHQDRDRMVRGHPAPNLVAVVCPAAQPAAAGSARNHGGGRRGRRGGVPLRRSDGGAGFRHLGTGHPPPPPEVTMFARIVSAASRLIDDPDRAVGLMGWIDTQVPSMGTVYWFLIAGGIAFLAAPFLGRRQLAAFAALLAILGTTWVLLDVSISTITNIPFWQARYGFPIWMGIPVLLAAAYVAGPATKKMPIVPLLRWSCALGLIAMHVFSVAYLMVRYMYGTHWFGPVGAPGWTPYAQTTLLAATAVVAAIVLSVAVLLPGSTEPSPVAPADDALLPGSSAP